MKRNILITGGAGFIGSHVVRLFVNKYPEYHIINLDKLTYAGNLANLKDIEGQPNYTFVKADICDFERIIQLFKQYNIDSVIHLAAESHVDRSIKDPFIFAQTNVMGTLSLLQAAKLAWETSETGYDHKLFYHISTDEVYGALDFDGTFFTEQTKYQPHSPYSASKAGSDHFVRAFHDTYGMPVIVTNCSNNYGPYQFPEKLIPLFINNIRHGKALPVYGKGENVRDWLYVVDHARAIDIIFHKGKIAETYNIGGFNEWTNIDLIKVIIKTVDRLLGNPIIPIGPPFLQTVNEPLLLAAGTDGYIIEHRQHAFFNKLGNTPRSNQYLEQFREPPTVQAARCGSHTQFLCGRITLPHLRVRSGQGMMSLVYHNQSRSITRLIPVPGQPLDSHHPDRSILPPDTIFSQRFLHLRHQFPTMGNKPYPAAGRRHELTDHRCQQMCLARTGGHISKNVRTSLSTRHH